MKTIRNTTKTFVDRSISEIPAHTVALTSSPLRKLSALGGASTLFVMVALGLSAQAASAQPTASRFYLQHNIVSDGAVPADVLDPALVNPWGLTAGPTSPWWVANNGTGIATLYAGNRGAKVPLNVSLPGAPTGIVFNGGSQFVVRNGALSGPARFIFSSEDGTISGWSPTVSPTQALVAADNSASGAVYKGLAIATTAADVFLYAANFHAGTVDVFDSSFNQVTVAGGFADPSLPDGYAPFGIQEVFGLIFVTYALQDAAGHDDVPGEGHGFINAFDTSGNLLSRVASNGKLNSPWGLTVAPTTFGLFGGSLLVGNSGDGRINAFDLTVLNHKGEFLHLGQLHSADGPPINVDGLRGLGFGNGGAAGSTDTLFFTAGPSGGQHGVFGSFAPAPPPGNN